MKSCVVAFIGGMFCACVLTMSSGQAADSPIMMVEEDWEIVVNEPDAISVSPQVTFFTSPSSSLDDTYFQLQMNYAADDSFSAGGFHVAAVRDGNVIDEARSATRAKLVTDGDRIRWTSVMAVINGHTLFAVKDGDGHDWGEFGGPEYLVTIPGNLVPDLSQYHPLQSLAAVDVGYGANRVQSITLRAVRVYYADGGHETLTVDLNP